MMILAPCRMAWGSIFVGIMDSSWQEKICVNYQNLGLTNGGKWGIISKLSRTAM